MKLIGASRVNYYRMKRMLGIDGVVKRLTSWAVGFIARKSEEKNHKLLLCGHGESNLKVRPRVSPKQQGVSCAPRVSKPISLTLV